MAEKYLPPGWDEERVMAGLNKALGFGIPTRVEDRATFFIPDGPLDVTDADTEGVPWDPATARRVTRTAKSENCAVEYLDKGETSETFGVAQFSRVVITLLDPEYQKVKGFDYVVAGGDKYYHTKTQPPVALGSIDVWTVLATAQDER